jgi:excisionase family DNA binding protein
MKLELSEDEVFLLIDTISEKLVKSLIEKTAILIEENIYEKIKNDLRGNNLGINKNTEWLTIAETCKLLGVTKPTLHIWSEQGKVIKYRISSRIRYKREEIENAIKNIL